MIEYLEHAARANHLVTRPTLRDALRGSRAKIITSKNLHNNPCHGEFKALKAVVVDRVIDHLITERVIGLDPQTRGEYSFTYLSVGLSIFPFEHRDEHHVHPIRSVIGQPMLRTAYSGSTSRSGIPGTLRPRVHENRQAK